MRRSGPVTARVICREFGLELRGGHASTSLECVVSSFFRSVRAKIQSYSRGSKKTVRTVELIKPPMTTVARGRCTSAPVDVAIAMGTNPRLATSAVINTGRSRRREPFITASRTDWPSFLSWLIELTRTTPFRTATPKRAMKPTDADRFRFKPRSQSAAMPPINANGMFAITNTDCFTE